MAASRSVSSAPRVSGVDPGAVLPEYRGRGIHAALIADRARRAQALNCDLVTSQAELGGASERNLRRMGFATLHVRGNYPATEVEAASGVESAAGPGPGRAPG
jgi:GNAT superfamily N-acetyltransferase